MAKPISFPEANSVLRGGDTGADDLVTHYDEQTMTRTSCWSLSLVEMEEIRRTGVVWLSVKGPMIPPMRVDGVKPIAPIAPVTEEESGVRLYTA